MSRTEPQDTRREWPNLTEPPRPILTLETASNSSPSSYFSFLLLLQNLLGSWHETECMYYRPLVAQHVLFCTFSRSDHILLIILGCLKKIRINILIHLHSECPCKLIKYFFIFVSFPTTWIFILSCFSNILNNIYVSSFLLCCGVEDNELLNP